MLQYSQVSKMSSPNFTFNSTNIVEPAYNGIPRGCLFQRDFRLAQVLLDALVNTVINFRIP